MVTGKLMNRIMVLKAINGRLIYIRVQAKPFNLSLIDVYAPTEKQET